MKNKEIRLVRLNELVREFGTIKAVADLANTDEAYLGQILNRTLSASGKPRNVGDVLAAKLERGCEKPDGWMDSLDNQQQPTNGGAAADAPGRPNGDSGIPALHEQMNNVLDLLMIQGSRREEILNLVREAAADAQEITKIVLNRHFHRKPPP